MSIHRIRDLLCKCISKKLPDIRFEVSSNKKMVLLIKEDIEIAFELDTTKETNQKYAGNQ